MSVIGRRERDDSGFSLVEVLASLFVFALLTLGLIPLLTSSIRGSNNARADTIGKNAALKAMERVRGLPFYISYATSPDPADLLDLYYPNATGDVVRTSPTRTVYVITCPWNNLSDPACPSDVPENYTIEFEAQFVDPVASGAQPTPGETATSYANVPPAATYRWDSLSADTPPRQILQMTITAFWTTGDTDESYTINSLITDRSFGGRKNKATATVGYGLDIYSAYDANPGGGTDLSAGNGFIISGESDIEGRRLSTARHTTTAVRGEIQDNNTAGGGSLATAVGAMSNVINAPPDQPLASFTAANGQLRHPDFANAPTLIFGPSAAIDIEAIATSAAPSATGDAEITGVIPGQTEYVAIKDPQLVVQDFNEANLSTAGTNGPSIVSLVRSNGLAGPLPGIVDPITTGDTIVGGTQAITNATNTYAQATTGFDRLLMLKTTFIPDPAPWVDLNTGATGTLTGGQGAVVVVDDFQAAVQCDSESDGDGDGEAQYQATLYYWADPTTNGNRNDARYVRLTFNVTSASAGADPLAAVAAQNPQAGQNNGPLVYDHASANQRIYLFGKTLGRQVAGGGGGNPRVAYLTSWNSLTTTASRVDASTDATGAAVSSVNSSIDGAIEIETADLDSDRRDVGSLDVSLGAVSCYAEDAR